MEWVHLYFQYTHAVAKNSQLSTKRVCNAIAFHVSSGIVDEYCQHETMRGRCRWKSEVIVMTSARWGRMKTGRCLNIHPNLIAATGHDPLFLGCSADVLSIIDRKCSGRSECDIRIPDPDLDTVTPCYPDQKCYLEASYTCVKGTLSPRVH